MSHHIYIPRPPLSEFVGVFWYMEDAVPAHQEELILPDGSMQLVINLHEDRLRIFDQGGNPPGQVVRGSVISGIHTHPFLIDATCREAILGIHFKPGGALPFVRASGEELRNSMFSLDTLWGPAAADLRTRLLEAGDIAARFRVLEAYLLSRALLPLRRHPAVAFALRRFERGTSEFTIAEVATQTGLSSRRFIQLFRAQIGLTPKRYCRILRFQQTLRLLHQPCKIDWVDLALQCGYFDQAHMIKDFREFSGVSPTTYLQLRTGHYNHLPHPPA